jgi:hypothetical protein
MNFESIIDALKIIAGVAVFFVWVVRYANIKKEFEKFGFPSWFRDMIGILKISFTVMLQSLNEQIILLGAFGIVFLMSGAIFTHIKVKNPMKEMLPAIAMISIGLIILSSLIYPL